MLKTDAHPSVIFPFAKIALSLDRISKTKKTIAVAGTHGKTTTSSMLSLVLAEAGVNPSFLIGGEVNEIGCGALWDKNSQYLVMEADESDGTFLEVEAEFSIVQVLNQIIFHITELKRIYGKHLNSLF